MKTLTVLAALAALTLAPAADAKVINTNWVERADLSNGKGFVRLYVRKIAVTRSSWKAWVGLTNKSATSIRLQTAMRKDKPDSVFSYWAGPGIWWTTREPGGSWWPGSGTSVTHSVRASTVAPRLPTSIAVGKSWFGTFSGPTAKLPKTRLLRIGFGVIAFGQPEVIGKFVVPRELVLSTTHQFKLPKL